MICGGHGVDCEARRSALVVVRRGALRGALCAVWCGGLPRGVGSRSAEALVAPKNFESWFCNKQCAPRGGRSSPLSVSAGRADALTRRGALMFHVKQRRSLSGVVVLKRALAIQTKGLIRVVATRGFVRRTLARVSGEGLAPPRKILRVSFAIN